MIMDGLQAQAQAYTVKVCKEVLLNLAQKNGINPKDVRLRIDMCSLTEEPLFAVFDKVIGRDTLREKCTLKQVIHAGGGKAMAMILSVHIRNIIRDIFAASLQQFAISDTKQVFLSLYLSDDESEIPMIAVYKDNRLVDDVPTGSIIGVK